MKNSIFQFFPDSSFVSAGTAMLRVATGWELGRCPTRGAQVKNLGWGWEPGMLGGTWGTCGTSRDLLVNLEKSSFSQKPVFW